MGTPRATTKQREPTSLADALFSATKQRVLGLLFGQPDRSFGTAELIGLARSGSGAVQRELERLLESGLVIVEAGAPKRYRANRAAPIFEELRAIVEKTSGVAEVLRQALAPHSKAIPFAVLFGSVAKGQDTATSDIDVLVVSDTLGLEDVYAALQPAERALGRPTNPTLYTQEEFRKRRRAGHAFLARLLKGKYSVILGSEDAVVAAR